MKCFFSFYFLIAAFLLSGAGYGRAGERVALVIGNSAYQHTPKLPNPRNDAEAVISVLEKLGFTVVGGLDLTRSKFIKAVRTFSGALKTAEVGLFFYAGHGLQVNGRNYLVPIDAELKDEADLEFAMVELDKVLRQMERSTKTNLLFIDACRDNPLARNLARAMGLSRSASIGRGLASVSSGVGTMITFATQPDNVALDGKDKNSPFTKALLRYIETPGLDISPLLRRVRRQVIKETNGHQVPWNHSSLTSSFVFKQSANVSDIPSRKTLPEIANSPPSKPSLSHAAYQETRKIGSCRAYKAYRSAYSQSFFSHLAAEWIEKNCKGEGASKRLGIKELETDQNFPFDGYWTGEICSEAIGKKRRVCRPRSGLIAKGELLAQWGVQGKAKSGSLKGKVTKARKVDLIVAGKSGLRSIFGKPYSGKLRGRVENGVIRAKGKYTTGRGLTLHLKQVANKNGVQKLGRSGSKEARSEAALAREIQSQLKRIGCYRGLIDGDWGPGSRRAVIRFNTRKGAVNDPDLPSGDLLSALELIKSPVCPAVARRSSRRSSSASGSTRLGKVGRSSKSCRLESKQECIQRICPTRDCGFRGSGRCSPANRRKICR